MHIKIPLLKTDRPILHVQTSLKIMKKTLRSKKVDSHDTDQTLQDLVNPANINLTQKQKLELQSSTHVPSFFVFHYVRYVQGKNPTNLVLKLCLVHRPRRGELIWAQKHRATADSRHDRVWRKCLVFFRSSLVWVSLVSDLTWFNLS